MNRLDTIRAVKYYVLRIDLSDSSVLRTSAIIFRKLYDQIDLDQKLAEIPLKDILEQIPRRSMVVVVFSGDQVLSRFSSGEPKNLFDEIEEEDFYFQKAEFEKGWTIQSACRKTIVDPVFDLMILRKLFLLHMVFDPAVIPTIADLLGDITIASDHFKFQFKDGSLLWIMEEQMNSKSDSAEDEIIMDGMSLPPEGISMLAGLVHYLNEGPVMADPHLEHNEHSKYYRRSKLVLTGILTVLLLGLLINFFLFSSIQQNIDRMKTSGENQAEVIHEIERLETQIEEFRLLYLNRINASGRSYSYYLEELASNRPSGVWFNQLVVDPIQGKQESGKSIETDRSQINLTGETLDPVSLNKFISALKDLPWVSDIELKNYELSQESSRASFELTIRKVDEL